MNQKHPKTKTDRPDPVSLAPLKTEQALTALLAAKPLKAPEKKPIKRKKPKSG